MNETLFDILMQEMLHVEEEMSSSDGKTIVRVEGVGLLFGKFIVKSTLIRSLFFWFEGTASTDENVLVWFICKRMEPRDL